MRQSWKELTELAGQRNDMEWEEWIDAMEMIYTSPDLGDGFADGDKRYLVRTPQVGHKETVTADSIQEALMKYIIHRGFDTVGNLDLPQGDLDHVSYRHEGVLMELTLLTN